jgi:hypothetical protein
MIKKASVLSNHLRVGPSRIAGDRTVTLAMSNKALSPAWGKSVGGVSERAGVRAQEEQSFGEQELLNRVPSRVVAAKGILVFGKVARFAVRRWNGGLGRLVIGTSGSSAGIERAGDSGCPKEA